MDDCLDGEGGDEAARSQQGLASWLRDFANWNPMSAVAAACRSLFGCPNPSAAVRAWPMQHPELIVLAWSAALIVVLAPTAVLRYRRKVR